MFGRLSRKGENNMLRVAAYQSQGPVTSIQTQIEVVKGILQRADQQGIDIVCFPECFLTGYYSDRATAERLSFNRQDPYFLEILSELSEFSAVAILGFNERVGELLYNSVTVIEKGTILGIQRKHFLYHDYFTPGIEFTPIPVKGVPVGVLVCLDSNYLEPARILALQGTKLFFVPMCNRVPIAHPFAHRPDYYSHFIARTFENNCWLVTADWVYQNNGETVCPGHSCIYDPNGREVKRSKENNEQLLVADIPDDHFSTPVKRRVTGSEVLNHQLADCLLSNSCSTKHGAPV